MKALHAAGRPLRVAPGFQRLWWSTLLAGSGRWSLALTFGWLAFDLSNSAALTAIVGAAVFAPMLCALPGGALADRVHRPRLLALTYAAALGSSALPALVVTGEDIAVWQLALAALMVGALAEGTQPARMALMADLVGEPLLPRANALLTAATIGSRMAAPAATGAIIAAAGILPALLFALAWYAPAAIIIATLDEPRWLPGRTPTGRAPGLTDCLATMLRDATLRRLLVITILSNLLVWPAPLALLPVFAAETFSAGAGGLAWLTGGFGAGTIAGTLALAATGSARTGERMLLWAAFGFALALAAFALAPHLVPATLFITAAGTAAAAFGVMQGALVLLRTKPAQRGRASGWLLTAIAVLPVGMAAHGTLAGHFGIVPVTLTASALFAACAATLLLRTRHTADDRSAPSP